MAIVPFEEAISPPDPLTAWVRRMEDAVRRAREAAEKAALQADLERKLASGELEWAGVPGQSAIIPRRPVTPAAAIGQAAMSGPVPLMRAGLGLVRGVAPSAAAPISVAERVLAAAPEEHRANVAAERAAVEAQLPKGGIGETVTGAAGDVARPVAGFLSKAADTRVRMTPLGRPAPSAKQTLEALDVPRREVGVPIARQIVNLSDMLGDAVPPALRPTLAAIPAVGVPLAIIGSLEAALDAAGVSENTRTEALSYLTDPLNLVPWIGVTRAEDLAQAARMATRAVKAVPAATIRGAERYGARALESGPGISASIRATGLPELLPPPQTVAGRAGGTSPPPPRGPRAPEPPAGGGPPAGAAGAPPPPTPPPDPVAVTAKLNKTIKSVRQLPAESEELRHAVRQQRAAQAYGALGAEGKTATEKVAGVRGAVFQKGEMPRASFDAPEAVFTPTEIDVLKQKIIDSKLQPYQIARVDDALGKVLGGQLDRLQENEMLLLEKVFGKEMVKAIQSRSPTSAWGVVVDVLGIPRNVLTTADISGGLRQGAFLGPGHPVEWAGAMKAQVRAFASETAAKEIDDVIRSSPWFERLDEAGLYLAPLDSAVLSVREEAFLSRALGGVPIFRNSQRAYVTVLNKLRNDVAVTYASKWEAQGALTAERLKSLTTYINAATGRGDLGKFSAIASVLTVPFFAPRLLVSRFQLPAQLLAPGTDNAVRMLIARDLASFMAAGSTVLGLAALAGATVELDPRSSDFAKAKFGKTRIDPWGGFQPLVRYTTQFITGQRTSGSGNVQDVARTETFLRFFRSKLSPSAGAATSAMSGESMIGEKWGADWETFRREMYNSFIPMWIQDVRDGIAEEGLRGGLLGALAATGLGVQTYETFGDKIAEKLAQVPAEMRTNSQGEIVNDWGKLTDAQQTAIEREHPEIAKLLKGQGVESESAKVTEKFAGRRVTAFEQFQKTGDAKAYRETLSTIGSEARGAYGVLFSDENEPERSEDRQLIANYFKVLDRAGDNMEERDRLDAKFRALLRPPQAEVIDAALLSSPDRDYENLKRARAYLDKNYWGARDEAYIDLLGRTSTESPLRQYKDYSALTAAAERDPKARALLNKVDDGIVSAGNSARIKDPKADAYLYIYGYKDDVLTKEAKDLVLLWAKTYGVSLATPRLRSLVGR